MLILCSSLELQLHRVNALYSALLDFLWEGKQYFFSVTEVLLAVVQFLLSEHKSENDNCVVCLEGVLALWNFFFFLIHV